MTTFRDKVTLFVAVLPFKKDQEKEKNRRVLSYGNFGKSLTREV